MMKTAIALVVVAAIGCGGPEYVYTPEASNATVGGMPAARTSIPPERPQGGVDVVSYGTTQLHQGNADIPALHVRMTITNDGDAVAWAVDTREQLVDLPGEGRSSPIYVASDVPGLPVVSVARGQKRVLDLYFPLPATMKKEKHLAKFEVLWQVKTPERVVASRTAFDRVELEPYVDPFYDPFYSPYYAGYGSYWGGVYGPNWWYAPYYPRSTYVHSRPIAIRDERAPVQVGKYGGSFRPSGTEQVSRRP